MPTDPPEKASWPGPAACDEVKHGGRGGVVQPAQRRSPQPAQGAAARTGPMSAVGMAGGEGSSAAMAAQIRRLEQRLEAERRHVDKLMQKLERRVEEVACASSAGGRWAELQGYVDGLAETVQGLIRGAEDGRTPGGSTLPASVTVASSSAAQHANMEAMRARADAVSGQVSDMAARFLDFGERLGRMEHSLEHVTEVANAARGQTAHMSGTRLPASENGKVESMQNELQELTHRLLSVERGVLIQSENSQSQAWEAEGSLMPSCSEENPREDELAGGFSMEDVHARIGDLYEQVAALRNDVEDQGADLSNRVHEAEQTLEDLAHSHNLRQQESNVNEQVMRLALRTQRDARNQEHCEEDLRCLRGEVLEHGEELGGLWMRVEGTEVGIENLSAALNRICEDLADVRSRAGPAKNGGCPGRSRKSAGGNSEDGANDEIDESQSSVLRRKAAADEDGDDRALADSSELSSQQPGERPPLRSKVQDVERGLNDMAQVVFDLRKQVSSIKSRQAGNESIAEDNP